MIEATSLNLKIKYPVAIAAVFIWIGFIGAISFMEAWLKFRAPGITLPLGLGIGRLVFAALNKVELVLSVVISLSLFYRGARKIRSFHLLFLASFLIVLIQTFWLLPALDARAELHIQGQSVTASYLHVYYVIAELIKMTCLLVLGIKLLNIKN